MPTASTRADRARDSTSAAPSLPVEGYVRVAAIIGDASTPGVLPLSRSHFYDLVRNGTFPAPIKFGRAALWRVDDVRRMLAIVAGSTNEAR